MYCFHRGESQCISSALRTLLHITRNVHGKKVITVHSGIELAHGFIMALYLIWSSPMARKTLYFFSWKSLVAGSGLVTSPPPPIAARIFSSLSCSPFEGDEADAAAAPRMAAPSRTDSTCLGRTTGTPSTSAWVRTNRELWERPPQIAATFMVWPRLGRKKQFVFQGI